MPARDKGSYAIQSVENALNLLEVLGEESGDVRISQLSAKLGLNKTSVFRLMATFERRGYVERTEKSGNYRLGLAAYEIGQKFLSRMGLLSKAKPVMERLARECNEAVYLAVSRGTAVLFIDLVDTIQQVKAVSLLGRRFPMDRTAAGKVILAAGTSLESDLSEAEREVIKRQGICWDQGTLGEGIVSLAAPLFDAGGQVSGALCLVGPEFRLIPARLEEDHFPRLKEAAEVISSKLGHVGHYLTPQV